MSAEAILSLSVSVIALGVSIYSAVLATQVGKREQDRDRKRITLFLDYLFGQEIAQLTIVNVGHRPITISSLGLIPEGYDQVPKMQMYNDRYIKEWPLPVTLTDGEHISLPLSDVVSRTLFESNMKATISLGDAEGNTY